MTDFTYIHIYIFDFQLIFKIETRECNNLSLLGGCLNVYTALYTELRAAVNIITRSSYDPSKQLDMDIVNKYIHTRYFHIKSSQV